MIDQNINIGSRWQIVNSFQAYVLKLFVFLGHLSIACSLQLASNSFAIGGQVFIKSGMISAQRCFRALALSFLLWSQFSAGTLNYACT